MKTEQFYTPNPVTTLNCFERMLDKHKAFCFVRFSDGEMEIIRNRYLQIGLGKTHFRGKTFTNEFPGYDSKEFNPERDISLRQDLLSAACSRKPYYYKGIPTSHNKMVNDRDLMVRLNGGLSKWITFSDLLMNSNYRYYRERVVPLFTSYLNIYLVANYRAKPAGILNRVKHIPVDDNFFANYEKTKQTVFNQLKNIPSGSLVISSASSLSNIIGNLIYSVRNDITFIDIGTSLNDLLCLDSQTRSYHKAYFEKGWSSLKTIYSPSYTIRW